MKEIYNDRDIVQGNKSKITCCPVLLSPLYLSTTAAYKQGSNWHIHSSTCKTSYNNNITSIKLISLTFQIKQDDNKMRRPKQEKLNITPSYMKFISLSLLDFNYLCEVKHEPHKNAS